MSRKQKGYSQLSSMLHVIAGATSVALSGSVALNSLSIPLFGVPLTVITMAAGGALVSTAYGEPVKDRRKLYIMVVANTFLASVFVAVFPHMFGWEWSNSKLEPALAAIMAASLRWVVPSVIKLIPEVLRKWFRLENKKDQEVP